MAFISKETIDMIHNTADIVAVVGEYTKLDRRSGNDWWGCCPFHGEKTASFHVSTDKKFYHCFGCKASGDVIKFTMEMEKIDYPTAIENLAKKFGIPVKYDGGGNYERPKEDNRVEQYIELYERTSTMFHYFLMETEQGKKALEYLDKRGVTRDIVEKFKLGYSPADKFWLKSFLKKKNFSEDFLKDSGLFSKNYPDLSFFNDRLMFPIFNRKGQVVAFGGRILHAQGDKDRKYLNSGDLIQFKKRETLYAFNFAKNSIRQNKKIIFCEGYMDCIAYHQAGIDYAVATLGTALTEDHIKIIRGFVDEVLLSFDADGAGQKATLTGISLCRKADLTVKIIRLKGGKDPSEILLNYGKENLTAQVNSAIIDSDYLLESLSKKYPVDTPEGKTKAALEFFPYIDSLTSDIQKESCLEQLCQAYNLKPEAVKRDFNNRNKARERDIIRPVNTRTEEKTHVVLNAELRGLIAVIADVNQFQTLRSQLSVNDFYNPSARELYTILEQCSENGTITIPDILNHCNNDELNALITDTISSGVYKNENIAIVVNDTIKYVKKNRLEERSNKLLKRIKEYVIVTEEDQKQFNALLVEKMELDKQAQQLSK